MMMARLKQGSSKHASLCCLNGCRQGNRVTHSSHLAQPSVSEDALSLVPYLPLH